MNSGLKQAYAYRESRLFQLVMRREALGPRPPWWRPLRRRAWDINKFCLDGSIEYNARAVDRLAERLAR